MLGKLPADHCKRVQDHHAARRRGEALLCRRGASGAEQRPQLGNLLLLLRSPARGESPIIARPASIYRTVPNNKTSVPRRVPLKGPQAALEGGYHLGITQHLPLVEPCTDANHSLTVDGLVLQVMQKRQLQAQHASLATLSIGALSASSTQIRQRRPERQWSPCQKRHCCASWTRESVPATCMSLAIPC